MPDKRLLYRAGRALKLLPAYVVRAMASGHARWIYISIKLVFIRNSQGFTNFL